MTRARPTRGGYTLLELLVVIAIIAVLAGLVVVALTQVRGAAVRTETVKELRDLDGAIHKFMTECTVKEPPPGRLLLSNKLDDYKAVNPDDGLNALRAESWAYLHKVWPRLDWNSGIDWTGGKNPGLRTTVLDGDQVLVFFLGGIQKDGGCTGFAADLRNPTRPGHPRVGPFYNFQTRRLVARSGPFLSYRDAYEGEPFAYLSSGRRSNDYGNVTCLSVSPYYVAGSSPKRYLNPDRWQIISAGRDGVFGQGGPINLTAGTADPAGADDLSNFADGPLGTP